MDTNMEKNANTTSTLELTNKVRKRVAANKKLSKSNKKRYFNG